MKNIKVELVALPPDLVLINATEKPYLNENVDMGVVTKVVKHYKHESVAEHTMINFNISGISRLCLQELARHRMTEFNIESLFSSMTAQSTRFTLDKILKQKVDMKNIEKFFVIPEYDESKWVNFITYNRFINTLKEMWIQSIVTMKLWNKVDNVKNDYLKYMNFESLRVELAWSINVRSLRNFLTLRTNQSAHFEIRHLANLILESLKDTHVKQLLDQN